MLTDLKLRNAKPQAKPYKLADGNQLYLLVTPSGSKLWRMNYSYDSKQKTLSIGPYPLIGLGEARAKRDEARKQLLEGKDPGTEKRLKVDSELASARTPLRSARVPGSSFRGLKACKVGRPWSPFDSRRSKSATDETGDYA